MEEKINQYTCHKCRKSILTRQNINGVTPFMIQCVYGCNSEMKSHFHEVEPIILKLLKVEYEWVRPNNLKEYYTAENLKKLGHTDKEISVVSKNLDSIISLTIDEMEKGMLLLQKI